MLRRAREVVMFPATTLARFVEEITHYKYSHSLSLSLSWGFLINCCPAMRHRSPYRWRNLVNERRLNRISHNDATRADEELVLLGSITHLDNCCHIEDFTWLQIFVAW